MIYVSLIPQQREELTRLSHQAIGRVALLAHMVLLSNRGFSVPQIAAIYACGQDVVRTWLHRYHQQGVAGLEDEPRSGRPLKHPLEGWIVDTQASQSPPCSGQVQTCWAVFLHHALFGRLDAFSRRWWFAAHTRKLAVHFGAFLHPLVTAYPTGPLALVLDQTPAHTTRVAQTWLKAHPRVTMLWLPRYAAHELNPAERIWGLMKSAVAANRLASSIEALVAAALRFFTDPAPYPVKLPLVV
jgi:hypothetical protein